MISPRRPAVYLSVLVFSVALLFGASAASADPPVFENVPANMTVEATSAAGALVVYTPPTAVGATVVCAPGPGSTFPLGTTTVTCTATDTISGDTATATFTVTVQDTRAPTLTNVPGPISVPATSPSGATVNYTTPSANDAVDGSVPVSCAPASGSTFPVGTTSVNCSATDSHSNTASASFSVTVGTFDNTPPVLNLPGDITTTTESPGGKAVTYSASATDNVDGSVPVSCSPGSGSTFPVGTTTVNCSATDSHGNQATGSFKVTVTLIDNTPPVLNLPGDIDTTTEAPGGKAVSYFASATDNVDGPIPVACNPASGSTFPVGTTTVNCAARDSHGNTATGSFKVKVTLVDDTPPVLNLPDDIQTTTDAPSGKAVSYTATATDNLDGSVPVSCNPPSGSTFSVGTTTVNCSATDSHRNTATGSFKVKVTLVDNKPPVLSLPSNINTTTEVPGGKAVTYTATATDNIDGPVPVSCAPASGSTFPIGTTTVNCSATDSHGNTATGSFRVTVTLVDNKPPVLSLPSDINTTTEEPGGKAITYSASATDNIDGSVPVSCAPASGSTFPVGTTTVNCSATDSRGNKATGSFKATVVLVDTTPPVLSNVPADITGEAAGPGGLIVTFTEPTATDNVDGLIAAVTCAPAAGTRFPLGTTTVTCSATDGHGNKGSASFKVIIRDTRPPVLVVPQGLTVTADASGTVPAYHSTVNTWRNSAQASDTVDASPTIASNVPEIMRVGVTTVTFTARDDAGNATSKTSTITVQEPGKIAPPPPPAPKPPPPEVTGLGATAANKRVTLKWSKPAQTAVDKYEVMRSQSGRAETRVYSGTATRFVDRNVQNGVQYTYLVIVFVDGSRSAGASIVAVPKAPLLRKPKEGSRVKLPAWLVWGGVAEADYYNAQVHCRGTKMLTAWPVKPMLRLQRRVKYNGHVYVIRGQCILYVWAGFGSRADANYGPLLGEARFIVP